MGSTTFKRTNYAKFCMPPSLDRTLPESVISQENNSPLTFYIDFQIFSFFLDINSLVRLMSSITNACSIGLTYINISIGLTFITLKFIALDWIIQIVQTFADKFLKSFSIHPLCINVWGSFSFK